MLPLQNKDHYGRDMLLNVRLFGLINWFNCSAEKNKSLGLNLHFDGNIVVLLTLKCCLPCNLIPVAYFHVTPLSPYSQNLTIYLIGFGLLKTNLKPTLKISPIKFVSQARTVFVSVLASIFCCSASGLFRMILLATTPYHQWFV